MKNIELANYCLTSLKENGMEKAEFSITSTKKYEMNVFGDEITLLRTTIDSDLNLVALTNGRKGLIKLNKTEATALDAAIASVIEMANNSEPDTANDISPMQPALKVHVGDTAPDLDTMYQRLESFIKEVKQRYPKLKISDCALDFTLRNDYYANTNGVSLNAEKGVYSFVTMFSAIDGTKSSSFNYTFFTTAKLDKEILDCGSIDTLLRQSVEQLDTTPIDGKFTGEVILTPDCLGDMLEGYISTYLRDIALISGTSTLKDKLHQKVASEKLTIHSNPVSEELSGGYFITSDGFEAKNITILDKGVLNTFMLSQYGANKTGKERALNPGAAYVIEPGNKSFADMVKSINRGILVARFSGGNPSKNGDFSGIAKNSYYIENGEIKYPISETMIAGNLNDLFNNIIDVSSDRINFGNSILPWISAEGITITGK